MSGFHEAIDRATQRLRHDRELRLDVSHELQTHLDAALAEYREAGYEEDAAEQAALKDLGDTEELAEDLWQANRFRMRLRAWAWWVARLTLLPACIVATGWFLLSGLAYTSIGSGVSVDMMHEEGVAGWAVNRIKARMTDEQRLIFYGDEAADNVEDRWRALRDRYPESALYQLHYIKVLLSRLHWLETPSRPIDPQSRQQISAELERGMALDSENGIYDMLRAAMLLDGVEIKTDDTRSFVALTNRDGKQDEVNPKRYEGGIDQAKIDESMRLLEKALHKPYITMHTMDMLVHRMHQLPEPSSAREYLYRIQYAISELLPELSIIRKVAIVASIESIRRSEQGDRETSERLLMALHDLSRKLAAESEMVISLMVARSIYQLGLHTRVFVERARGDEPAAQAAIDEVNTQTRAYYTIWRACESAEADAHKQRAGAVMAELMSSIPGYDVDVDPFRQAEYTQVDRGALSGLLMLFIVLSLLTSGMAGWRWLRSKDRDARPMLLWPGWRRYAKVLGLGVLLPVGAFAVFVMTPWSGRELGLNATSLPLLWYLPAMVVVLILAWMLGTAMLRRRAMEVGMVTPSERSWKKDSVFVLVILGWVVLTSCVYYQMVATNEVGSRSGALVRLLGTGFIMFGLLWVWVGREMAWLNGLSRWFLHYLWTAILYGCVIAVVMVLLSYGLSELLSAPRDRSGFMLLASAYCLPFGLLLGWFWSVSREGRTPWFAASAIRSMSPVFAGAGLVLALTVGPVLQVREAVLAGRMVAQSPVWIDLEVERSDAKVLRAQLAEGAVRPPRLPGVEGVKADAR